MPRNSKNRVKVNSNQFELLNVEDDSTNDNVARSITVANAIDVTDTADATDATNTTRTSARGRPLKPTQPYDPEPRPARKKAIATKANATTSGSDANENLLLWIEDLLKRVEERAERAEKRVEALEEFIRNELFPCIATPPEAACSNAAHQVQIQDQGQDQHLPPSPPPSPAPGPLPGVGLDLSRVQDRDIKEGNAGTVRRRANEALKGLGVSCLGVNSKGNGRYRLLFREADIDKVRQDDSWIRTHFDKATFYGEQWYPLRVNRAYHAVAIDELGCAVFGQMNGVKVHKMQWLGTASVDKEYRSMVVYVDKKEEANRLLAKQMVKMANGKCAFTRPFVQGLQPARYYRCYLYRYLHYRCKAPVPMCGQCAQPGHFASGCTSDVFKCAACDGKGAHKATDPGCPVYRRELAKLRPSTY